MPPVHLDVNSANGMVLCCIMGRLVNVPKPLIEFAARFVLRRGDDIETILFSPQPFTQGEVYIVCKNEVGSAAELLVDAYSGYASDTRLFCLRRKELWEPASTHWFVPSGGTCFPNPAYAMRTCGVILHGVDLRDEIPLPDQPKRFLQAHIEGCRFYVRNHQILKRLALQDYAELIARLEAQFKYLMASTVVIKTSKGFLEAELAGLFSREFAGSAVLQIWNEFRRSVLEKVPTKSAAFEAVWIFECFLRELHRIAA